MSFLINPNRFAVPSFPVVESVTGQSFPSNATSFNVDLPASVVGDLLLLHLAVLDSGTIPGPEGWTNVRSPSSVNIFPAKLANGPAGGTSATITKTSTSTTAASQIIWVSNWSGNLAAIEHVASSTLATPTLLKHPNLPPPYGES